ncbi:MAG: hypothetical protein Rubg2KO_29430 [Rubricoccaceae bacterium]
MRLVLLVCLALLAVASEAQPTLEPSELIRAMEDAVSRLDYDTAELRAREALARFDALTPDQLVTVHTALGVLLHTRNEPVEARRQLEAALSLDPALELDSVLVSPKTLQFFRDIQETLQPAQGPPGGPAIRYVVLSDPRPDAAFRSLLLPGWGQFYKGNRAKGWAFAATGGTLAASTLAATLARSQAQSDYTSALTVEEAEALYPAYNRWHRTRNALAIGTAVVWAASALEALATGGPVAREGGAVELAPEGLGVQLRVSF